VGDVKKYFLIMVAMMDAAPIMERTTVADPEVAMATSGDFIVARNGNVRQNNLPGSQWSDMSSRRFLASMQYPEALVHFQ
jgi:hypothetical protein